MTMQELQINCKVISSEIDREVSGGDIQGVQDKLMKLSQLIALSAECVTQAKRNYLYKQSEIIKINKDTIMPASILSKKIESDAWEESGMLTYCERLNAGIVHSIDALRSIISLYKTELTNNLISR